VSSPFVLKLFTTYNDAKSVAFLSEFAQAGDLSRIFCEQGLYGSEEHVKYYAAGVIHALQHLHELHIIFRDLKPENILLCHNGHPKLTNFAIAKIVIGSTFTICGTPTYMAPEMLMGTGHNRAVDWWSLGVLIFELMAGFSPFQSDVVLGAHASAFSGIMEHIMCGIGCVEFPASCSGNVQKLVLALIVNEPAERLAMRQGGVQKVLEHSWFSGFDWEAMKGLHLEAPYRPSFLGRTDHAHLQVGKTNLPSLMEYHDDGTDWDKDFSSSGSTTCSDSGRKSATGQNLARRKSSHGYVCSVTSSRPSCMV